jgi:hypothetical protein
VSPSSHLKMETDSFRNVAFSSYVEFWTIDQVHEPEILGSLLLSHSSVIPTVQPTHLSKPTYSYWQTLRRRPLGSDVVLLSGNVSKMLPSSYSPSGSTCRKKSRVKVKIHVLNYVIKHYSINTHAGVHASGQLHAPVALPSGEIVLGTH